ncbi:hypothetical protein SAMN05421538_104102 [Paracoccus isoporae]|uniref:Uncharacterized protein n=1 Tax=Paracoccus isoporae TaxID=591205 RepID=A0A1G7AFK1_9RHOB|nr:hypothetical protein [Paracoccus isoporae]SDE12795.1 hypothetical protein SAMN05421538_104102 [Paracoccus isoporae]
MQFFTLGRTLGGIFALILILTALGAAEGDVTDQFGEGKAGTVLSGLMLALIGLVNFRIYHARRGPGMFRLSAPETLWLLLSLAFLFLFLDETFQIHEGIDRVFHLVTVLRETAATDRIDDLIILAYGLIGVGILVFHRREVTRIPRLSAYLIAGFVLTLLQTGFDALTNGEEFLVWLDLSGRVAETVHRWASLAEEALKLLAEAVLLAGFGHALRYLRAQTDRD